VFPQDTLVRHRLKVQMFMAGQEKPWLGRLAFKMLTMVQRNLARIDNGVFYVDRKFHTGMQEFLRRLQKIPILSVHPQLPRDQLSSVMDLVSIPERQLGYKVMTIECTPQRFPVETERRRLDEVIRGSRLVYNGGLGSPRMCVQNRVPFVPVLECDLRTEVSLARLGAPSPARAAVHMARVAHAFVRHKIPAMRHALSIHCNGYPIYREVGWFNQRRLLYLDSRLTADSVISPEDLSARLAARRLRTPRLIFSGRLEAIKGPLHLVKAAALCKARGLLFELHIYGQGSQQKAMEEAIAEHGLDGTVLLHGAVPYPELVNRAKDCDVFVCCHLQADPSCTYLESLGCGLPIVGYGNAMWRGLHEHSGAGIVTKEGDASEMADALCRLIRDGDQVDRLSLRAMEFAREHTYEIEFSRRTDSLEEILGS
jgi:colanic acid/amylovoran biosynthesis glycosyltransferase